MVTLHGFSAQCVSSVLASDAPVTLTGEIEVDVQDAAVADLHGRIADLAGSDVRHGASLACRVSGGCVCVDEKGAWCAGVFVV